MQSFLARADAFEAGLLVPAIDRAGEVEMVVDQARDNGCALDVDDFRVRTDLARYLGTGAACDDAAVGDRECLDDTEVCVHGQDLAVGDHGVGWLLRKQRAARECSEYAASYPQDLCRGHFHQDTRREGSARSISLAVFHARLDIGVCRIDQLAQRGGVDGRSRRQLHVAHELARAYEQAGRIR